ncbi:MAG: histidine kinase [Bacteroidetes bacterium]|nr:histidine kinase [Bacteroidota bacterium]
MPGLPFHFSGYPTFVLPLRIIVSILAAFLIPFGLCAQQAGGVSAAPSSNKVIPASPAKSGSSAIVLINNANKKALTSPAESATEATQALEVSIKTGDKTAEAYSYQTLGTLMYNSGNYASAIGYFNKAIPLFQTLKDNKGLTTSQKYLSLALENSNEYRQAAEVESKLMAKNTTNNADYYTSAKRKARMDYKSGRKKEAIAELERVVEKDDKIGTTEKLDLYKELGELYLESKDTIKALSWMFHAAAGSLNAESPGATAATPDYYNDLNNTLLASGHYEENLKQQTQLLELGQRRNNAVLQTSANLNLGSTYLAKKQYSDAIPYLDKGLALSRKTGNVQQQEKAIRELSTAYEKMGAFDKALETYKQYVGLVDSFKNLQIKDAVEKDALNRQFSLQADKIRLLELTQKDRDASLKRQNRTIWFLAVGLLLLGGLIYWLFTNIRQKQRANMLIRLQSLRAQMNPHFIFNSLNSVNNFIAKNDERSANKYLSDFSKLMRTVLKNSDENFIPLHTEIETLKIYLNLEHFRFGDKFDFTLEVSPEIDQEHIAIPPMLIQPYIENAIWHGLRYREEKGHLEVNFYTENEKLICKVKDNGIGRKKSAALKTDHQKTYQSTGIRNTKERIDILNKLHSTQLQIQITDLEEPGGACGTEVLITLPFLEEYEMA